MEMKELTKLEELVMIAIWRLKDESYGVKIKNKVKEIGGREYFYNTLYTTFDQLTRKGYLTKHFGEPSAVRGGKRKVYFHITKEGIGALEMAFKRHNRVWAGISDGSFRRDFS
jgi:DNA-binding PadR family transcriptional regulator